MQPAGTGEQPSIAHGDSDREGGRGDQRDRPRRGGDAGAAGAVATGTRRRAIKPTSSEPGRPRRAATARGPIEDREPEPQAPAVTRLQSLSPTPSRAMRQPPWTPGPERPWQSQRQPGRAGRGPARAAPTPAPAVVEPTSPPPQPSPEEASAPARKGWWQRKLSGE